MSLIQLKDAQLAFGPQAILDKVELVIQPQERLCLVGRNGCGKSTLLKVLAGETVLDDGQRIVNKETVIARLEQDPPQNKDISIFDYVAEGLSQSGELLKAYFRQTHLVAKDPSEANLNRLQELQHQLEHHNAWEFEQRIEQVLSHLELSAESSLAALSGGWRRKAALAKALVSDPDVLLLDEPTNHLDVATIQWLEKFLQDIRATLVFVSHDRAFIRAMATRILDLDRGNATSYPGSYQAYLDKKAEDLAVEATHNAAFDKKLSQEENWIRQGIKARRTRNEGRVRALKAMRQEHAKRRQKQGRALVTVNDGQSSGKMVLEAEHLSYQYETKPIVEDLSLLVQRGDKLALIGPNGCGKSTLIRLLLGRITPDKGKVRQGSNLDIAYFDQHREALDHDAKVVDAIADGKREVTVNGRTRHVISHLQDYLFTPDRLNAPVYSLSGGERNRLLLAKLLLKPSNLLILDEPTNDLDVETLELLEETLSNYQGTVLLVSHDREFVDNVVTSSLYFEGHGRIREFVGGYADVQDWYRKQAEQQQKQRAEEKLQETKVDKDSPKPQSSVTKPKKLSYKYQLELQKLPEQIEKLELQVDDLQEKINDPDFFKQDSEQTQAKLDELARLQQQLETAYQRWDELESMAEQ
ncbi:Spermidine/putrescine import ATP-binding protein PotA [Saliniradius amylolyticus]|uniref:ATP-binding protein Uup n=1 Tax=Saliniradius amylolyticus TaxID=2183582 RepID=A0A2S2E313_9ALTE|nr:ABC transporter ATP-binding protein [Saliniradius amylolyticus]AWL11902.1 Spermidine/putrescine import ATP-binding protein PotA [Saliniradius amylolyticus]